MPHFLWPQIGVFTLTALLASGAAQAAREVCPQAADIVRAAYKTASPPGQDGRIHLAQSDTVIILSDADFGGPFTVTCKVWPANTDLLLAAVPLMQAAQDTENGHEGDLDILVLDNKTLQVRQRRKLTGLMSDDAVRITGVSFDTARYDVTPDLRAFGVRISREGASRANPYSETSLRLFVLGANQLGMVLDGLIADRSSGEWDTNCAGKFSERASSVSMDTAQTNGYRNLIAIESHESSRAAVQHGDCREKTVDKGKTRHIMKFDGKQYLIPETLRSLDRDTAG